jgi:DNA anti-recombination protein RmuC
MTEFDKFNEEFAKIGERIDSLSRQFNTVNTTRTNQLVRSVEKIKLEETDTAQTPLLD